MPTYDRGFQLGLLPEKKWNWRTFATSYGILTALILLLIVVGIMAPDTLLLTVNYHVTELIPRPALKPERLPKPKPLPVQAKLLPPAPVFEKAETDRAARRSARPSRSRRKLSRPRWR
jgi:hypothetical protein